MDWVPAAVIFAAPSVIAACVLINEMHKRRIIAACEHDFSKVTSAEGRVVKAICKKCPKVVSLYD